MTPEQFDHAAEECTKAMEEFALFAKKDSRSKDALGYLKEIIALAKAAIPSGQVAEDVALVKRMTTEWVDYRSTGAHAAIDRLAAQAQSAHEWFAKWEQAETLVAGLRKDLAGLDAKWMRAIGDRDRLAAELAELRDMHSQMCRASAEHQRRADEAEARCARLSAAGQVLSAHVDNEQCPCLKDSPLGTERPCPEHDAGWTIRDEFAKAAMQGLLANPSRDGLVSEFARDSVLFADAVLAELQKGPK